MSCSEEREGNEEDDPCCEGRVVAVLVRVAVYAPAARDRPSTESAGAAVNSAEAAKESNGGFGKVRKGS